MDQPSLHLIPRLFPTLFHTLLVMALMTLPAAHGQAQPIQQPSKSCVGLCTELSGGERATLASWVYSTAVLGAIEEERHSSLGAKTLGYGVKLIGYSVGGIEGSPGRKFPAAGGVLTGIASGALNDLGDYIMSEADKDVARRIVLELNKSYTTIVGSNGKLNRDVLKTVTSSSLQFLYSPAFQNEVGAPQLLQQIQGKVTADQLSEVLKDTTEIKLSIPALNLRIQKAVVAIDEIKKYQSILVHRSALLQTSVSAIGTQVDKQQAVLAAVAQTGLPRAQQLALVRVGALSLDSDGIAQLEKAVTLEALKESFDRAATTFAGLASGLQAAGLGRAASGFSAAASLMSNAGAFAIAYVSGNPLGMAQSGLSLIGSLKAFGGASPPSAEVVLLRQLQQELRALSKKIDEYHAEEMKALHEIASTLRNIDDRLQREFGKLFFDVATLRQDVRELLSDATQTCGLLVREWQDPEAPRFIGQGFPSFGRWFSSNGRDQNYVTCMTGLAHRLEVLNEVQMSGLLQAESVGKTSIGETVVERRAAVRKLEQEVLYPTIRYVQKYSTAKSATSRRDALYTPQSTVCDVYRIQGQALPKACNESPSTRWAPTRLKVSEYNPGGGTLLSPDTILELSRYVRILGPWDMALIERSGSPAPSVITAREAETLTPPDRALRTRSLQAMQNAADALDVSIAQAQLLAGVPVLLQAAEVLDTEILPTYAQARLLGKTEAINKLLGSQRVNAGNTSPDCATGNRAFDTLCLMQSNPWFSTNVVSTLLTRRLEAYAVSDTAWRRIARLPASGPVTRILGADMLLLDAAQLLPDRISAAWAFELPSVNALAPPQGNGSSKQATCWDTRIAEKDSSYYKRRDSSVCYMLPHFSTSNFRQLSLPYGYEALVGERAAIKRDIASFCESIPFPAMYCSDAK